MPYRNSLRMRPINTLKHIVDSQNSNPPDTKLGINLVTVVENAVSTNPADCDVGSKVSSVFLNVQVVNGAAGTGSIENCYMMVYGNPGNNIAGANVPNANIVGQTDFRKMVFHQEMVMLSNVGDSIPITLFKGVIKIPSKFQRLGVNDTIVCQIFTPLGGPTVNVCIQCIYKEIR